tara:strand:- start:1032 stop:1559 length:528 start_codon:yes stop_codon:yes gene_type:complete
MQVSETQKSALLNALWSGGCGSEGVRTVNALINKDLVTPVESSPNEYSLTDEGWGYALEHASPDALAHVQQSVQGLIAAITPPYTEGRGVVLQQGPWTMGPMTYSDPGVSALQALEDVPEPEAAPFMGALYVAHLTPISGGHVSGTTLRFRKYLGEWEYMGDYDILVNAMLDTEE